MAFIWKPTFLWPKKKQSWTEWTIYIYGKFSCCYCCCCCCSPIISLRPKTDACLTFILFSLQMWIDLMLFCLLLCSRSFRLAPFWSDWCWCFCFQNIYNPTQTHWQHDSHTFIYIYCCRFFPIFCPFFYFSGTSSAIEKYNNFMLSSYKSSTKNKISDRSGTFGIRKLTNVEIKRNSINLEFIVKNVWKFCAICKFKSKSSFSLIKCFEGTFWNCFQVNVCKICRVLIVIQSRPIFLSPSLKPYTHSMCIFSIRSYFHFTHSFPVEHNFSPRY